MKIDQTGAEAGNTVAEIEFSHYRPTPDSRRFSISSFAVTGKVEWEAKPGGEFSARIEVVKGAFAKMIPFTALEAAVRMFASGSSMTKVFVMKTVGGKNDGETKEKSWTDSSVISAIEIPWVAEYAFGRWSVGGPREVCFSFEDNQRVRTAVIAFLEDTEAAKGDAMAILRVLKPDEAVQRVSSAAESKSIKHHLETRPGDVLVTFRASKVAAFTVFVPVIGKLQFVAG